MIIRRDDSPYDVPFTIKGKVLLLLLLLLVVVVVVAVPLLFISCLLAKRPSNMLEYLGDGFNQKIQ